jgi:hypothetical protein
MKGGLQRKQLRSFGLMVGGIFLVIGIWPMVFRGEGLRIWAAGVGLTLIVLGLVFPASLAHVHRAWMAAGHVLGWINTRIILGIFFYAILTPFGVAMRLLGKDFMHLKPAPGAETYRFVRKPRPGTHYKHPF